MAKVILSTPVGNSLSNISVHQQQGINGLIIPPKGWLSPEMMKHGREFHRLCIWQAEFSGAGKAASRIMTTCKGVKS